MVVTELRNAVVDTIEFIIPPIVKLAIVLMVANYITYGYSTFYLSGSLSSQFKTVNIAGIKTAIDGLYLSGVIPVIAVLLLITLAYVIDRSTNFIGALVPVYYHTISTLKNKYFTVEIWLYFTELPTVGDLDNKIKQLYTLAQATNSALPFDQMKWQEEAKQKLFRKITFSEFLLIWSIASYWFVNKYFSLALPSSRLWIILIILFTLIIAFYFQVSKKEVDIENTRLVIVSNFLKADPTYSIKKNTSTPVRQDLEHKFDLINAQDRKWWWLSVGYRTDWLMMFKCYRLRFPFYKYYERWKFRSGLQRNRH
ncbi:MAG TPA: hypothetical protein VF008_29580 [Niastella sp.]